MYAFLSCVLRQSITQMNRHFAGLVAGWLWSQQSAARRVASVTMLKPSASAHATQCPVVSLKPPTLAVPALLGCEISNCDGLVGAGESRPAATQCPNTFLTMLCSMPSDLEIIFTTDFSLHKALLFFVLNFLVNVCFTALRNFPPEDNLCLVYLDVFPSFFFPL